MKTAFVVLTYNRSDALLAVLRALAPQCGTDSCVVIADDGSNPAHVQALRTGLPAFVCPVRHVWHPDTGFTASQSRNLGALHAKADYVVFMDGDCVPHPGFVRQHRLLAQGGAFVNGSRVLLSQKLTQQVVAGKLNLSHLGLADWLRLRQAGDVNKLTHLLHLPSLPGRLRRRFYWRGIRSCNFGVWMDDFEAVNGFDETFSGWGHEDADLVLRLHNLGRTRKNGCLATEVFHLWHRENSRAQEAVNRLRVEQRERSGLVRAARGLDAAAQQGDVVVTELNHR
jgi:GT2 family glycosyltransferase